MFQRFNLDFMLYGEEVRCFAATVIGRAPQVAFVPVSCTYDTASEVLQVRGYQPFIPGIDALSVGSSFTSDTSGVLYYGLTSQDGPFDTGLGMDFPASADVPSVVTCRFRNLVIGWRSSDAFDYSFPVTVIP